MTKNAGRFPRNSAINSFLKRLLTCINLSTLEPVGLTGDRKRPDELTLGPWLLVQRPKPSMGCNSCGHFCLGPLQRHYSARQVGFAATGLRLENAKNTMNSKAIYHFQPVATETTGIYGKSTAPFLSIVLYSTSLETCVKAVIGKYLRSYVQWKFNLV